MWSWIWKILALSKLEILEFFSVWRYDTKIWWFFDIQISKQCIFFHQLKIEQIENRKEEVKKEKIEKKSSKILRIWRWIFCANFQNCLNLIRLPPCFGSIIHYPLLNLRQFLRKRMLLFLKYLTKRMWFKSAKIKPRS